MGRKKGSKGGRGGGGQQNRNPVLDQLNQFLRQQDTQASTSTTGGRGSNSSERPGGYNPLSSRDQHLTSPSWKPDREFCNQNMTGWNCFPSGPSQSYRTEVTKEPFARTSAELEAYERLRKPSSLSPDEETAFLTDLINNRTQEKFDMFRLRLYGKDHHKDESIPDPIPALRDQGMYRVLNLSEGRDNVWMPTMTSRDGSKLPFSFCLFELPFSPYEEVIERFSIAARTVHCRPNLDDVRYIYRAFRDFGCRYNPHNQSDRRPMLSHQVEDDLREQFQCGLLIQTHMERFGARQPPATLKKRLAHTLFNLDTCLAFYHTEDWIPNDYLLRQIEMMKEVADEKRPYTRHPQLGDLYPVYYFMSFFTDEKGGSAFVQGGHWSYTPILAGSSAAREYIQDARHRAFTTGNEKAIRELYDALLQSGVMVMKGQVMKITEKGLQALLTDEYDLPTDFTWSIFEAAKKQQEAGPTGGQEVPKRGSGNEKVSLRPAANCFNVGGGKTVPYYPADAWWVNHEQEFFNVLKRFRPALARKYSLQQIQILSLNTKNQLQSDLKMLAGMPHQDCMNPRISVPKKINFKCDNANCGTKLEFNDGRLPPQCQCGMPYCCIECHQEDWKDPNDPHESTCNLIKRSGAEPAFELTKICWELVAEGKIDDPLFRNASLTKGHHDPTVGLVKASLPGQDQLD